MNKPIIGITAGLSMLKADQASKVSLVYDYILAVEQAGGVPVLLPPIKTEECVLEQVLSIDGLILSGGGDVYPPLYGEQPSDLIGFVDCLRDEYELKILEFAVEQQKPLFGICRGAQVMNVAFGGDLYQDISFLPGDCEPHIPASPQQTLQHEVDIEPGTFLFELVGTSRVTTNSSHHQVIKKVAAGFTVNARTKDGLVEGIEKMDNKFLLGLQWHPERMLQEPCMRDIFANFVQQAKTKRLENC